MKDYPYNRLPWKSIVEDGYPTKEEFGHYPTVLVSMLARKNDGTEMGRRLEQAELRFFGGNPERPYWCSAGKAEPIENSAWHVTHWTPFIAHPGE